ncbi:MAG: hypothetical protein V1746_06785 [bacterium]
MKRCFLIVILALQLGALSAFANEHIVVSGGPALFYFEKHKAKPHDKYWGNFIDAAAAKIRSIKPSVPSGDTITWMVYRTGYEKRGKEQGDDLLATIAERAKILGANLVYFNDRKEFLNYLNDRPDNNLIARLEYFGHSNKRNWMFDYSNRLDGSSIEPAMLHIWNLKNIDSGIFASDAVCQSWGCHSGEEYSAAWFKRTGRRMTGAIGKTDYSQGGLPFLSTEGGKWVQ